MHRLDWDDLRFLLALAERGSLAAAARELGVNHTTVLRRLDRFEERAGVRLFDRLPTGYTLTPAGEELAAAARQIDETVASAERRVLGRDLSVSGNVRMTTADTLMSSVLPPLLAAFRQLHPQIELDVGTSHQMADLTRREADLAVRPSTAPPPHLFGRRVAELAFAPYAGHAYLERVPKKRALERHVWIAPNEVLFETSVARWMTRTLPNAAISLFTSSLVAMQHAALAGLGVAALPCYLGDTTPGLCRIRAPLADLTSELWVLTHEDLKSTARVRVLLDFLGDRLHAQRDLLEGRRERAQRG